MYWYNIPCKTTVQCTTHDCDDRRNNRVDDERMANTEIAPNKLDRIEAIVVAAILCKVCATVRYFRCDLLQVVLQQCGA